MADDETTSTVDPGTSDVRIGVTELVDNLTAATVTDAAPSTLADDEVDPTLNPPVAEPDLIAGIAKGLARDRFESEERIILGFQRFGSDPFAYEGPCPTCGRWGATVHITDDGVEHGCPTGECTLDEIRASVDHRLKASRAAVELADVLDMWQVMKLEQVSSSPTHPRR